MPVVKGTLRSEASSKSLVFADRYLLATIGFHESEADQKPLLYCGG